MGQDIVRRFALHIARAVAETIIRAVLGISPRQILINAQYVEALYARAGSP
jgi:hypothetical protein